MLIILNYINILEEWSEIMAGFKKGEKSERS